MKLRSGKKFMEEVARKRHGKLANMVAGVGRKILWSVAFRTKYWEDRGVFIDTRRALALHILLPAACEGEYIQIENQYTS